MEDVKFEREGYNFSERDLKDIQLIELEMLIEVDRICLKYNIKYCISAGTLLGAIRHGGFIPWDDDADVAFLRSEYERFREACVEELDHNRFYFQDSTNTPGYRWGYGKLRRKGTRFIRLNQEFMPYEQGIFIDLMPYDSVPDQYIARKIHTLRCFIYRKCFWAPVGARTAHGLKKLIYQLFEGIPDEKLFACYYNYIAKINQNTETRRIRISTIPVPGKEGGYLRNCFINTVPISFEKTLLIGMKDYQCYLSYKYGDYMKIPPIKKRKIHPVSSLQLIENDLIKQRNR